MTEQEIRERLKRYDKARISVDLQKVGAFADWLAEELERQLERNHRLDKQLTEVKEAGKPFVVFTENQFGDSLDSEYPVFEEGDFTVGEFSRLTKALKEVKLDNQITENKCKWVLDEDGIYQTGCDGAWELTCGDLSDNKVKYCPYCGGQIEEVKDD